jgi:hypothetical protein
VLKRAGKWTCSNILLGYHGNKILDTDICLLLLISSHIMFTSHFMCLRAIFACVSVHLLLTFSPRSRYPKQRVSCGWATSGGEAKEIEFPSKLSRTSENFLNPRPLLLAGQTNVFDSAFPIIGWARIWDNPPPQMFTMRKRNVLVKADCVVY